MPNNYKTIGILGGMGPEASCNLYAQIIKYAQQKYGAVQDSDFPPIIINSLSLQGTDETGIFDEKLVQGQLIEGVKKLEAAGCDFIIIACNTVHHILATMQSNIKIPIFSLIEKTKDRVIVSGYTKVALFTSETTNRLKLYQNIFDTDHIEIISSTREQQDILTKVIKNVMQGIHGSNDTKLLNKIIREYVNQGAQAVILGCTEFPLAINQTQTEVNLIDSVEVIAQFAVDFAFNKV